MTAREYFQYYLMQAQYGRGAHSFTDGDFYRGKRFGNPYRGAGLFSGLLSRVRPLIRGAASLLRSKAAKSAMKVGGHIFADMQRNRDLRESVKDAIRSEGKELAREAIEKIQERLGETGKRKASEIMDPEDADISGGAWKRKKLNLLKRAPLTKKPPPMRHLLALISQLKAYHSLPKASVEAAFAGHRGRRRRQRKKKRQSATVRRAKRHVSPAKKKAPRSGKKQRKSKKKKRVSFPNSLPGLKE